MGGPPHSALFLAISAVSVPLPRNSSHPGIQSPKLWDKGSEAEDLGSGDPRK